MQAKDIADEAFLDAVRQATAMTGGHWATRWDVAAILAGHPEHVREAPVNYASMPEKVVLAKARRLIKRGLLDGCACGCRGDFVAS